MKCLVVEPSATLRRALRNGLRAVGVVEILDANDVQQAIQLGDGTLDLVITEWNLPHVSGLELTKRLRANPETARARVLVLTSRNRKNDVVEAIGAGVNGYLLKPFNPETLRRSLEALIEAPMDGQAAAA